MRIFFKILIFAIAILFSKISFSQSILETYINIALDSNLSLQKSDYEVQKRYREIQKARSLFYPSISINARYTVAEGGRVIDFPVGDLLNPVYQNLNANNDIIYFLVPDNKPPKYPEISNQSYNFYRPHEHETKLSATQPIFSPEIYYNSKISEDIFKAEKINRDLVKTELITEVKKSYFLYLKTLKIDELIDKTKLILKENLRVNMKLYENDKVTKDKIYSSQLELQKLNQQKSVAVKNMKSAQAYFNFLLDKDLNSEIKVDTNIQTAFTNFNLSALQDTASSKRHEIQMLDIYSNLADKKIKLYKSQTLPDIYANVDYGFQGEEYKFDNQNDFMLASLVLQWGLFKGLKNTRELQKAEIEKDIIELEKDEVYKKIRLEVQQSYYELQAAQEAVQTAKIRLKTAKAAFKIVDKKYQNGQAGLLEFQNARNEMTSAEINLIISKYDYLIQQAEFERVSMKINDL